tara:strand:+ start:3690 stop:4265 length:576 start_codon:yes stop_codon:yes gene_type:complete
MNVVLGKPVVEQLRQAAQEYDLYLEGGILKVISVGDEVADVEYLNKAKRKDKERRRERLEFTKGVQRQNKELLASKEQKAVLLDQLKDEKERAEHALETAKQDLDYAQRKNQFELVGNIVTAALRVIMGVGIVTTVMYAIALFVTEDPAAVTLLGSTWSNLLGILLTNSFSIVGTIMGVKYASDQREGSSS